MTISNSKYAFNFIAILAISLFFSLSASADRVVNGFTDPRSETQGQASPTCRGCWSQRPMSMDPYSDVQAVMHKVAIFDADPSTPDWDDPRTPMSFDEDPQLRAIGVILVSAKLKKPPRGSGQTDIKIDGNKPPSGSGTGFMINKCLMLTNHHVLNLDSNAEDVSDRKVEVYQKDSQNGRFGAPVKTSATVVAEGSFRGGDDRTTDWGMLKLSKNREDRQGTLRLCPLNEKEAIESSDKGEVFSAGFFHDKGSEDDSTLNGQRGCKIMGKTANSKNGWATNCPTLAGTSGSPVLTRRIDPKTKQVYTCALGILSSTVHDKDKKNDYPTKTDGITFNVIIPFSDPKLQESIREAIRKNPCPADTPPTIAI